VNEQSHRPKQAKKQWTNTNFTVTPPVSSNTHPRPSSPGIDAEWQDIQTTRLRRGYNRSSIVTPGRIPTRHLPLIARSPTYPREESVVSQQNKMTPRGVTFYTTGSEADEEEEKPKKNPLFWTPKSFKNLFLPSVPHPKGIGTGSYVTGLLNK
jgi:hypothetical protein